MKKLSLLSMLLISCATKEVRQPPLPKSDLADFQRCDTDTDCVRATNGCCDCANGGEAIAVHRKHEKTLRDFFPCTNVMCTQKAGDCMYWIPFCNKGNGEKGAKTGLCTLKPPGKKL